MPAPSCGPVTGTATLVAPAKHVIGDISYHVFWKSQQPELFRAYHRIRYQVFVLERGWRALPHSDSEKTTLEESFDARSIFCVGQTATPICALRATKGDTRNELPHQELYNEHLESASLRPLRDSVATMNSLAVLEPHRGKMVATHAMILLIDALWQLGARIVFGTVEPAGASAQLCAQLGFRSIDGPLQYRRLEVSAINMALVIGERRDELMRSLPGWNHSASVDLTEGERRAIEYCAGREERLLDQDWCKRLHQLRRGRFAE